LPAAWPCCPGSAASAQGYPGCSARRSRERSDQIWALDPSVCACRVRFDAATDRPLPVVSAAGLLPSRVPDPFAAAVAAVASEAGGGAAAAAAGREHLGPGAAAGPGCWLSAAGVDAAAAAAAGAADADADADADAVDAAADVVVVVVVAAAAAAAAAAAVADLGLGWPWAGAVRPSREWSQGGLAGAGGAKAPLPPCSLRNPLQSKPVQLGSRTVVARPFLVFVLSPPPAVARWHPTLISLRSTRTPRESCGFAYLLNTANWRTSSPPRSLLLSSSRSSERTHSPNRSTLISIQLDGRGWIGGGDARTCRRSSIRARSSRPPRIRVRVGNDLFIRLSVHLFEQLCSLPANRPTISRWTSLSHAYRPLDVNTLRNLLGPIDSWPVS
jgi:hypothetical protein